MSTPASAPSAVEGERFDDDEPQPEEETTTHLNNSDRCCCPGLFTTTASLGISSTWILRAIFFLLGVGILVPWNAFIAAKAYFESRLCDNQQGDSPNKNGDHLESTFAIVYNCSSTLSLGLLLLTQWLQDQKQAHHEQQEHLLALPSNSGGGGADTTQQGHQQTPSSKPNHVTTDSPSLSSSSSSSAASGHSFWLVMVPLTVYFVVFLGQALAVLWRDLNPGFFYTFTVWSLAMCGICGALASSGIVATAGLFDPSIAIEPYLAGQSAGGVGVSLANFIAASYEDPNDFWDSQCAADHAPSSSPWRTATRDSSVLGCAAYAKADYAIFVYFLIGSLVLAACLAGYAYVDQYQSTNHRDDYETVQDHDTINNSRETQNVPIETPIDSLNTVSQSPQGLEMNNSLQQRQQQLPDTHHYQDDIPRPISSSLSHLDLAEPSHPPQFRGTVDTNMSFGHDAVLDAHHEAENETNEVWSIVKVPAMSICLVFVVTLSLFPGWVSQLRSVHQCESRKGRWANDLYTPLAFVLFNVGDFTGRILAGYLPLSRMHHVSAKLLLASLLRFGFIPLFYFCESQHDNSWTVHNDFYSWLVQSLFAVSNGFVLTTAFIQAPSLLPNVTHVQERSAEVLNFALYLGLLSGSLLSLPMSSILTG